MQLPAIIEQNKTLILIGAAAIAVLFIMKKRF